MVIPTVSARIKEVRHSLCEEGKRGGYYSPYYCIESMIKVNSLYFTHLDRSATLPALGLPRNVSQRFFTLPLAFLSLRTELRTQCRKSLTPNCMFHTAGAHK